MNVSDMQVTLRNAIAATCAATVLVLGADYASFAATGDSLIVGQINHARSTTELVNHGVGPALRLKTTGTTPSLAVSSPARVRRLNADLLDGMNGADLATNVITYKAGKRADVYQGLAQWRLPLRPGVYQASFRAVVIPDPVEPGTTTELVCGLADLNTFGEKTHVYTADSATYAGRFPAFVSGAETVRITRSVKPGIVCATSDQSAFTLYTPVRSSWTRVDHRTITEATPVAVPSTTTRAPGIPFESSPVQRR